MTSNLRARKSRHGRCEVCIHRHGRSEGERRVVEEYMLTGRRITEDNHSEGLVFIRDRNLPMRALMVTPPEQRPEAGLWASGARTWHERGKRVIRRRQAKLAINGDTAADKAWVESSHGQACPVEPPRNNGRSQTSGSPKRTQLLKGPKGPRMRHFATSLMDSSHDD